MPRWVFLLAVGMLLVAVAFVVTCEVLGLRSGVNAANTERIRMGMTVEEISAILGCRPLEGDADLAGPGNAEGGDAGCFAHWDGPCGYVTVFFRARLAILYYFTPNPHTPPVKRLRTTFSR